MTYIEEICVGDKHEDYDLCRMDNGMWFLRRWKDYKKSQCFESEAAVYEALKNDSKILWV